MYVLNIVYLVSIINIMCFSCKENTNNELFKNKICKQKDNDFTLIYKSSIQKDTIKVESLKKIKFPFGSKEIIDEFPEYWKISNPQTNSSEKKLNKLSNKLNLFWNFPKGVNTGKITQKATKFLECNNHYLSFLFIHNLDKQKELLSPIFSLPKIKGYTPIISTSTNNNAEKRIYLHILNDKGDILDGINIRYMLDHGLYSSERFYYIDEDGIIYLKSFVYLDDKIIQESFMKYHISFKGKIVRYFKNKSFQFLGSLEAGKVLNYTKENKWIELTNNYYLQEKTFLEANYKSGIPVGTWKYYSIRSNLNKKENIIRKEQKGDKLLMTENYSEKGNLIEREILPN